MQTITMLLFMKMIMLIKMKYDFQFHLIYAEIIV